jgi:hypothetical protein
LREWALKVNNKDFMRGYIDITRDSSTTANRSFNLNPFTIYNNSTEGSFVEFKTLDNLNISNDAISLRESRIYSLSDKSTPLKLTMNEYEYLINPPQKTMFWGMFPIYTDKTSSYTVTGYSTSSTTADSYGTDLCYIFIQGAGGGGGGADTNYFLNQAAGGGGGGGGAGAVFRFNVPKGRTFEISFTVGSSGGNGSNGNKGTSGTDGGDTVVVIKENGTEMFKATAGGGKGGSGGNGSSDGKGGAGGTLTINKSWAYVDTYLNYSGGKGGNAPGGDGADPVKVTNLFEDSAGIVPDGRLYDLGHCYVEAGVIGSGGYNNNDNNDNGGAGGGSWLGTGGA